MNQLFHRLMGNAALHTRSGDLMAATAAIQAALAGHTGMADVIDVPAREVHGLRPINASVTTRPKTTAGDFIAGSHSNVSDRRDFKLYIPPNAGGTPLPLIVMLHGCTQNPDDFAAGTAMNTLAQAQGFFVLYPAQSLRANPQGCWNWFKHSHQARGRGEPVLLAGMTQQVMAEYAIDPQRVYVAGLSAGGAMAAILGDTYPDLFAAVGVHSGLAAGAATDLPSALGAMRSGGSRRSAAPSSMATIVFHGDADATVHLANAAHVIAASAGTAATVDVDQVKAAGGRSTTRSIHRAVDGSVLAEDWQVHGAPHAWSGGSARGSYTDAQGPDASAEMVRFFMAHPRRASND